MLMPVRETRVRHYLRVRSFVFGTVVWKLGTIGMMRTIGMIWKEGMIWKLRTIGKVGMIWKAVAQIGG